ncbi:amino acid racemase [Candidatus Albibeggiatoa sp. nov. NOAA]|uniref:aspartate/glutamate racemase family protein n=1 Tax=Candidatus Albibeggiatoa sp. nov. NOAA TaxID=3162724 RepID=UPI003302AC7F|nr:amino acid racemase [Thiotrichaceae bacterium]
MKTIGLIGGLSWVSTEKYYHIINQSVYEKSHGKHASAKIILCSVDCGEILGKGGFYWSENWDAAEDIIVNAANALERTDNVDVILICSNTAHSVAQAIMKSCRIELLHIIDTVANAIKKQNLKKIALLGTKPTMEKEFYISQLNDYGLEVLVPKLKDRNIIHRIIETELVQNKITLSAKQQYIHIINKLAMQGAEGVILGCTEIGLLIKQQDVGIPVFDTTELHAQAAVDFALS